MHLYVNVEDINTFIHGNSLVFQYLRNHTIDIKTQVNLLIKYLYI